MVEILRYVDKGIRDWEWRNKEPNGGRACNCWLYLSLPWDSGTSEEDQDMSSTFIFPVKPETIPGRS